MASLNGFANNDSDQSESKPSAFQPATSTTRARNEGLVKKKNITEAEKKGSWATRYTTSNRKAKRQGGYQHRKG